MNKEKKEIKEEILFEISFKLTNKNYKFSFATRRAWLVGISLIMIKLLLTFSGGSLRLVKFLYITDFNELVSYHRLAYFNQHT